MAARDVLERDVKRYRAWLKERYPWMAEAAREHLLQHLIEIKRFLHMIKYGKKPDAQEYLQ